MLLGVTYKFKTPRYAKQTLSNTFFAYLASSLRNWNLPLGVVPECPGPLKTAAKTQSASEVGEPIAMVSGKMRSEFKYADSSEARFKLKMATDHKDFKDWYLVCYLFSCYVFRYFMHTPHPSPVAARRRAFPPVAARRRPSPPFAARRRPSPHVAARRHPSPPVAARRRPSPFPNKYKKIRISNRDFCILVGSKIEENMRMQDEIG